MKNLNTYLERGKLLLDSYGIKYGYITDISVNTRAKSRWGQCRRTRDYLGNYKYSINISNRLVQDDVSDIALMNTLVHELLHTVEGCFDHTGKWKTLADKITNTSELTIKRTDSCEEKGLEEKPKKYAIQCTKCNHIFERDRMSDVIKNPQKYRCSCGCEGLVRIR